MEGNQRRLPPGQFLTEKWPVLHAGSVPTVDLQTWDFRIFGLVRAPKRLTWHEFRGLPVTTSTSDIHCVTQWSRYDNHWEGVSFRDVMDLVDVDAAAKYVLVHGEQGYTANLPLEDLLREGVLFAYRHDGRDLTPEHGWPLRLVVPHLYFWKSVKWVRGIEFLWEDVPGFWEQYGYHLYGDPWQEQRFRDDPEWMGTGPTTDEYYRTIRSRVRRGMVPPRER
ncbi:sulfite oxidase-like oxidoreductase [Alicyclobacillus shizuokensis]|uniref:sulfite oxidase-like oxidoreductase n=1 Tax=Alicyclobacillus shizuokensis TaxID=392014 RepID=UPI0008349DBE|nr:sulfite oxidase-like oxidoreductase [Alicyclobacillus shizuokensis]MCL6625122.1 sulfite oxidase-like oxidoreductase [Alicyclobacillus shizuokensis]